MLWKKKRRKNTYYIVPGRYYYLLPVPVLRVVIMYYNNHFYGTMLKMINIATESEFVIFSDANGRDYIFFIRFFACPYNYTTRIYMHFSIDIKNKNTDDIILFKR